MYISVSYKFSFKMFSSVLNADRIRIQRAKLMRIHAGPDPGHNNLFFYMKNLL
jgi:hypothetical protein